MNRSELLKEMIAHRRYLHMNPEIGHNEYNTQKYIINNIVKCGFEYQTINTSTICDLIIDASFETIALRADIDALALQEENECEYASVNEGLMHACGHDGHTAIQLGVMKYLSENIEKLKVNIRFIFQCDEENDGGAEEICKAGYLDGITAIYGLHLENDLEVGEIGYIYGQMNAGGDEVDVTVTGKQAHGAYPHMGIDSIVCSANIIQAAQSIVSRTVDPLDSTVITIGSISGPGTPNTICGQTVMRGTIRNLNPEVRQTSVAQFIKQAELIGEAMNCEVKVDYMPSYPPLVNNSACVDYVLQNAAKLGYTAREVKPSLGLEDFAYYVEQVPGAFYNVGSKLKGDYRNAHSSTFDFDEEALLVGALIQIENCMQYGR
ncbi:M20 family metallopeptidase [Mollicutes bacterium LVI A0078]|nr:M20 family metallopeptidase [Mollicutes bacterium LVI A0075]WOO91195.1 M20 family metallopeptidase [Mollicutes bacterium LVI A0078]